MKMIVADLIRTLQDMDPEAEVRLAVQPSYPMSYAIGDVVDIAEEDGMVVYIAEGGDGRYGNREIFG